METILIKNLWNLSIVFYIVERNFCSSKMSLQNSISWNVERCQSMQAQIICASTKIAEAVILDDDQRLELGDEDTVWNI